MKKFGTCWRPGCRNKREGPCFCTDICRARFGYFAKGPLLGIAGKQNAEPDLRHVATQPPGGDLLEYDYAYIYIYYTYIYTYIYIYIYYLCIYIYIYVLYTYNIKRDSPLPPRGLGMNCCRGPLALLGKTLHVRHLGCGQERDLIVNPWRRQHGNEGMRVPYIIP